MAVRHSGKMSWRWNCRAQPKGNRIKDTPGDRECGCDACPFAAKRLVSGRSANKGARWRPWLTVSLMIIKCNVEHGNGQSWLAQPIRAITTNLSTAKGWRPTRDKPVTSMGLKLADDPAGPADIPIAVESLSGIRFRSGRARKDHCRHRLLMAAIRRSDSKPRRSG